MNTTHPALIPCPSQIERLAGHHTLDSRTCIGVTNPCLLPVADLLRTTLHRSTGLPLPIKIQQAPACAHQPPPAHTILLWLHPIEEAVADNTRDKPQDSASKEWQHPEALKVTESYSLEVQPSSVVIRAKANAGVFYGTQTLLQLLPAAVFDQRSRSDVVWALPCVRIEDTPRFGWRGAMLDCGRHFFPLPFIKAFIDQLARHKLNVFHWHLTEDQGWRIHILRYPLLTQIGAWREGSARGTASDAHDGIPHGGFYTQDDIREVVAYAAERFVCVVPEIEMPGHAQAAIAAYPELGCSAEKPQVSTRWGVHETIFNVEETTFQFLENVLDEVIGLFPSRYIHIGADEAVKTQWQQDAATRARMRELGLDNESELQSYFVGRVGSHLAKRGRKLIGWDEIIDGGIPAGATVMNWRGTQSAVTAARAGHDVIGAWRLRTYLDFYQTADTQSEPLALPEVLPLDLVYSYDPVPAELDAQAATHIIGTQAQLWTENISTPDQAWYMAFPRLCALAEVAWGKAPDASADNFRQRLQGHLFRLGLQGIRYRPL